LGSFLCSKAGPAHKSYPCEIEASERETDALVYELYGLTEEEIAIVEGRDSGIAERLH
jgi:hypothetical protein